MARSVGEKGPAGAGWSYEWYERRFARTVVEGLLPGDGRRIDWLAPGRSAGVGGGVVVWSQGLWRTRAAEVGQDDAQCALGGSA